MPMEMHHRMRILKSPETHLGGSSVDLQMTNGSLRNSTDWAEPEVIVFFSLTTTGLRLPTKIEFNGRCL